MKGPIHSLVVFFAIAILYPTGVFASGSVSFEESAIPLLRIQPALLQFVQQSLDVAPTGNAVRLGKKFGDSTGQRVTPFSFEARPKGDTGPFTLLLIVNSPESLNNNDANAVTIEVWELYNSASKRP